MRNIVKKLNTPKHTATSDHVMMGAIRLRQPLPSRDIKMLDPFILLHHYGPFVVDEHHNPLDIGPHPHRGFEPVTFLIQGEQLHRDSLGNKSVVTAGDVQWTTAGKGIVHAEGPSEELLKSGGIIEGIQLWINLPASKKMMPANYQHIKKEDFSSFTSKDGKINLQIVAGNLSNILGKISTQTDLNIYRIDSEKEGEITIPIKKNHQSILYLIEGEVLVNDTISLKINNHQMIVFKQDGDGFKLTTITPSKLLFLSGEPINENIATYGPYVMNTQTELVEAVRDYQMGKMGFLSRN